MSDSGENRIQCEKCGYLILPSMAKRHNGWCVLCRQQQNWDFEDKVKIVAPKKSQKYLSESKLVKWFWNSIGNWAIGDLLKYDYTRQGQADDNETNPSDTIFSGNIWIFFIVFGLISFVAYEFDLPNLLPEVASYIWFFVYLLLFCLPVFFGL